MKHLFYFLYRPSCLAIAIISLSFFCCLNVLKAQVTSDSLTLFVEATDSKLNCHNDSTDIAVTAHNGTAPYLIEWENTTTEETGQITIDFDWFFVAIDPAKGGLYHFVATDAANKTTETQLLISEPDAIEFQLKATKTSCIESKDATISIENINGGTIRDNYQITWLELPEEYEKTVTDLGVGLQTVMVMDDNNCLVTDSVFIESIPEMQVQESLTHVSCATYQDGKIQLDIQGGTMPYTFDWSENTPINNEQKLEYLAGNLYKVTITDASQICQLIDSFLIEEPAPFELKWSVEAPSCHQEFGQIKIDSIKNAILPVYYSMDNLGFHDVKSFNSIAPGTHSLFIKDANACRSNITFQMPNKQDIDLELGGDALLTLGDSMRLNINQGTSFLEYLWQPEEGLSCTDCPNPMAQPLESTTYSLVAQDSSGCVHVDEKTIQIQKNRSVYIPNAFSPDNYTNDFFVVFGGQDVRYLRSLRIYNRWGSLMFEVSGDLKPSVPDFGWNGEFNGETMPSGIYLYEVEVEFLDGDVLPYQGEVYLIR